MRTVYEQIRKSGRVRRGDIGVRAQTITPVLAAGLGLARDNGVILADVMSGRPRRACRPAAGDLVVALDGKAMENGRQLQVGLYRRIVGDVVTLDILRDGQPDRFPVAMTERATRWPTSPAGDPRENVVARLGILGVDLNARIAACCRRARRRRRGGRVDRGRRPRCPRRRPAGRRRDPRRQPQAGRRDGRPARGARRVQDRRPGGAAARTRGELLYLTFVAD